MSCWFVNLSLFLIFITYQSIFLKFVFHLRFFFFFAFFCNCRRLKRSVNLLIYILNITLYPPLFFFFFFAPHLKWNKNNCQFVTLTVLHFFFLIKILLKCKITKLYILKFYRYKIMTYLLCKIAKDFFYHLLQIFLSKKFRKIKLHFY